MFERRGQGSSDLDVGGIGGGGRLASLARGGQIRLGRLWLGYRRGWSGGRGMFDVLGMGLSLLASAIGRHDVGEPLHLARCCEVSRGRELQEWWSRRGVGGKTVGRASSAACSSAGWRIVRVGVGIGYTSSAGLHRRCSLVGRTRQQTTGNRATSRPVFLATMRDAGHVGYHGRRLHGAKRGVEEAGSRAQRGTGRIHWAAVVLGREWRLSGGGLGVEFRLVP